MVCFLTHNINELIITNSYGYANNNKLVWRSNNFKTNIYIASHTICKLCVVHHFGDFCPDLHISLQNS